MEKDVRFYQASTSEMFGKSAPPQNETTLFQPRSPYAAAKLYSYWVTKNYREAYKLFACNGILFNHESPLRGETFVTRKITRAIADIYHGKKNKFWIGNLDAKRDWGHAKDYVEGMWKIINYKKPEDFVLATGKSFSVRDFCEIAFKEIGITIKWKGKGLKEKGYDAKNNKVLVAVDKRYFRPTEVETLLGDASKAKEKLNWTSKISFEQLVKTIPEMSRGLFIRRKQCDFIKCKQCPRWATIANANGLRTVQKQNVKNDDWKKKARIVSQFIPLISRRQKPGY